MKILYKNCQTLLQDRRTNLQAFHPCWMRANRHLVLNIHRQVDELEENEPGLPEPPLLPPIANPTVAHERPPADNAADDNPSDVFLKMSVKQVAIHFNSKCLSYRLN